MIRHSRFSKKTRIECGVIVFLWLGAGLYCYAQRPGYNSPKKNLDPTYIIQPEDSLEIFVWKEPDLTRKVFVRPDGKISFPLIQDLKAAGDSPAQLKVEIEKRLREYLKEPNVTVIVESIKSYKVFVVGKVKKPGEISADKAINVLQALSLAGGFEDFAKKSDITILRSSKGQNFVLPFNYSDVIRGKNSNHNIFLQSGDVVVVP